jgi:hypothetical protein
MITKERQLLFDFNKCVHCIFFFQIYNNELATTDEFNNLVPSVILKRNGCELQPQCDSNVIVFSALRYKTVRYTPKNISIKSTLNKIQYSTQQILVLNQYFKKVLKFKSILELFQIKLLKVSNEH